MKKIIILAALAGAGYLGAKIYQTKKNNAGLGAIGAAKVALGIWPIDTSDGLVD